MVSNHWHDYYIPKSIGEVVADLRAKGLKIDYSPDEKGRAKDGLPASAFIGPFGFFSEDGLWQVDKGNIDDCTWWPAELSVPEGAKSCIQLFPEDKSLNMLVSKLYNIHLDCEYCKNEKIGMRMEISIPKNKDLGGKRKWEKVMKSSS